MGEEFDNLDMAEEFYNKFHGPDGRFTTRLLAVKGQRGLAARAAYRKRYKAAMRAKKVQPNKDKSEPLVGKYKITGNRGQDAINITRLDRGSPERKAAEKMFEKKYGEG